MTRGWRRRKLKVVLLLQACVCKPSCLLQYVMSPDHLDRRSAAFLHPQLPQLLCQSTQVLERRRGGKKRLSIRGAQKISWYQQHKLICRLHKTTKCWSERRFFFSVKKVKDEEPQQRGTGFHQTNMEINAVIVEKSSNTHRVFLSKNKKPKLLCVLFVRTFCATKIK